MTISLFPKEAYCLSSGYERYIQDLFEVYVEYFPIVPYDLAHPTASEEFPIKFQITQDDYWSGVIHYIPSAFGVHVFFWDECSSSSWSEWKTWYPTTTEQRGLTVGWDLSTEAGNLDISASIVTGDIHHHATNYTKYPAEHEGKTYIHMGRLEVYYACTCFWSQVYAEGAGSLGIPNDVAMNHSGHHIQIAIQVMLGWTGYFLTWPVATSLGACYFITGDDDPASTDCWISVLQGETDFQQPPPEGGGGCPYVYTWAGQGYVTDNNLLPSSLMSNGCDVEDYYRLEQLFVPTYQGRVRSLYSLQMREFECEHDYIDNINLFAIDHLSDVNIAVTREGEILTYKNPVSPIQCVDNNGINRLGEISAMDGNVSDATTYFEGYPDDYLTLNFGEISEGNAKLILRTDMKKEFECIEVQVKDQNELWQTVETLTPRSYWSIEAVNLSQYVNENEDFMVRLCWKEHHRLDYVGLDTTPQESFEVHCATLISAIHSCEGIVGQRLLENDQLYVELIPTQQIQLTFLLPTNQNQERTFILYTEGHYIRMET